MTERRLRVLRAIIHLTKDGITPSFEQIARHCGLRSQATVHKHIEMLVRDEMIIRQKNAVRSIHLTTKGRRFASAGEEDVLLAQSAALHRVCKELGLIEGIECTDGLPEMMIRSLWSSLRQTAIYTDDFLLRRCRLCSAEAQYRNVLMHNKGCILLTAPEA